MSSRLGAVCIYLTKIYMQRVPACSVWSYGIIDDGLIAYYSTYVVHDVYVIVLLAPAGQQILLAQLWLMFRNSDTETKMFAIQLADECEFVSRRKL